MRTDPCVYPGRANSAPFPDTFVIITASGDTLAPDAESLVAGLEKDGEQKVVSLLVEDARHAFDKGPIVGSKRAAAGRGLITDYSHSYGEFLFKIAFGL